MSKLTIQNLAVVEFKNKTDEIRRWQKDNPYVVEAESCAYKVYWGYREDIEKFPDTKGYVRVRNGKEAYAFLTVIASGVYNNDLNPKHQGSEEEGGLDTHDRSQFKNKYQKALRYNPFLESTVKDIFFSVQKDLGFVDKYWLSKHSTPRVGIVAANLSGLKRGDSVLLVAELHDGGSLSRTTKNILHVLTTHRSKHAGDVCLTHPDAEVLAKIEAQIMELIDKQKFRSYVRFSSFEEISQEMERAERVYVCKPMGECKDSDELMISSWQGRVREGGVLTHMSGSIHSHGFEQWLEIDLDRFVSPECIREEMSARRKSNKELIKKACVAFKLCSEFRYEKKSPQISIFRERAPELF